MSDSFDLASTYLHLGLGATVTPLPDFEWSATYLESYERRFESDGIEGRLVTVSPETATWTHWERHPAGEEVVYLLSGRVDVVQDHDGTEVTIPLHAGEAMINPKGVWHRGVVHEPGSALFITPGIGTEHRPLDTSAAG
ncbi:MAG TPA: cupin domain-containing protein [Acidimicrobiales bacterium]|jgi:quercetin dioxygenase-like cupin family protein|nr:cupin domain-containing protein [Acidimicrobiales bacterium]